MAFYCVTNADRKAESQPLLKVINSLLAPCLSALVISCCEYFLITVNQSHSTFLLNGVRIKVLQEFVIQARE